MALQATVDFRLKTAADPANISTVAGWAVGTGSQAAAYVNRGEIGWEAKANQSLWYYTTPMQGDVIESEVTAGLQITSSIGAAIVDINGNGYMAINNSSASSLRLFLVVASQSSGVALGSTINLPMVTGQRIMLRRTISTDQYQILINGVVQASYTPPVNIYNPTYGACVSRFGSVRQVDLYYTPNQTVTSINGGSPITSSQSAVAAVTTGFTGLPTTITTNATGVTCGTISGTTNAPAWVQTVRTDGAVFPKSGTVVTYTFTKSAETASGTQTINKDTDQTAVIVASPINDDITYLFGAIFAVTGRSAANTDEVYHAIPSAMLTNGIDTILPADAIAPDGTMQFYNAGSFPCWVWTAATGINYYYLVTITENGGVVITSSSKNHYIGYGLGIGF